MLRAEKQRADEFRKRSISLLRDKILQNKTEQHFHPFLCRGWSATLVCCPADGPSTAPCLEQQWAGSSADVQPSWALGVQNTPHVQQNEISRMCSRAANNTLCWPGLKELPCCTGDGGFEHCQQKNL